MNVIGVILAAGEGTRFKSGIPKFLQKVCGWSLLTHSIRNLKLMGVNKIYVVLGKDIEKASPYLENAIVVKQDKRRGTADAFLAVLKELPFKYKDILLLYVDLPLIQPQTLKRVLYHHIKEKAQITILTMQISDPRGYGRIIRDKKRMIREIKEEDLLRGKEKQIPEVNVGVYLFKHSNYLRESLKAIKPQGKKREKYLTALIPFYYKKRLKISSLLLNNPEEGIGINNRTQLITANKILYLRNALYHIKKGVTVISPENTYIERGVIIGKDTIIYPGVYIESDVRIGKNCIIGPNSRIRSGSDISENVGIGNFVEIVRSRVGKGTKIRHFSYIGDTILGKNVNIGAGAVTANYDGKNKQTTIIKDGAFIGSNTTIVAPVKIGKRAVTGAGSVVLKNVADDIIVVGVPARILRRREDG